MKKALSLLLCLSFTASVFGARYQPRMYTQVESDFGYKQTQKGDVSETYHKSDEKVVTTFTVKSYFSHNEAETHKIAPKIAQSLGDIQKAEVRAARPILDDLIQQTTAFALVIANTPVFLLESLDRQDMQIPQPLAIEQLLEYPSGVATQVKKWRRRKKGTPRQMFADNEIRLKNAAGKILDGLSKFRQARNKRAALKTITNLTKDIDDFSKALTNVPVSYQQILDQEKPFAQEPVRGILPESTATEKLLASPPTR